MISVLMIDDAPDGSADIRKHLTDAGIEFSSVRSDNQDALVRALDQGPDLLVLNLDSLGLGTEPLLALLRAAAPGVATIVLATNPAQFAGIQVAACVLKDQLADLGATVRTVLRRVEFPARRSSFSRRRAKAAVEACGTADQLIERRAALDEALPARDNSVLTSILRRTPPAAAALVMIGAEATRNRFLKLLDNANIEVEQAADTGDALQRLDKRVHAVLFTDSLDLIPQARQLYSGSATHIVFIDHGDTEGGMLKALAAGANDGVSSEARGELFWAHLTTVRRIVGLASALQLALVDNRILSTIDELTRCASRRFFENQFPREVERAHRLGRPLSLVMADIDHFKAVNDTHGHQVGDEVLREFADRLSLDLRQREDWVARTGGEEFAVVLPETNEAEAHLVARRLCKQISESPFITTAGALRVTASFGVASRGGESGPLRDAGAFVRLADSALYESKRRGRNRVTMAGMKSSPAKAKQWFDNESEIITSPV
jgi:diguanylate cyclase (GGDEF)-like protein